MPGSVPTWKPSLIPGHDASLGASPAFSAEPSLSRTTNTLFWPRLLIQTIACISPTSTAKSLFPLGSLPRDSRWPNKQHFSSSYVTRPPNRFLNLSERTIWEWRLGYTKCQYWHFPCAMPAYRRVLKPLSKAVSSLHGLVTAHLPRFGITLLHPMVRAVLSILGLLTNWPSRFRYGRPLAVRICGIFD